jgi:hypothetical protein
LGFDFGVGREFRTYFLTGNKGIWVREDSIDDLSLRLPLDLKRKRKKKLF